MAYDKQKAHEYYIKYRKKGLLKGRKKGKAKTKGKAKKAKQESLVGVSTSGLNEQGKIEAAFIKDDMKKQMNEALSKAKTDEERQQIKKDYSLKAVQAINDLKNNSDYAQPKKAKAASTKATKEKTAKESSKESETKTAASTTKTTTTTAKETVAKEDVERLSNVMTDLSQKVDQLTADQEEQVKTLLTDIIEQLKKQLEVNIDGGQSTETDGSRTE